MKKKLGPPFKDPDEIRKPFSTLLDQEFIRDFKAWCKQVKISHGKGIELCVRTSTDNFTKDCSGVELKKKPLKKGA